MKKSIILLVAAILITGCKKPADLNPDKALVPDISDLTMSADMQKIFSERRERLMGKTGDGIVIIRSDYGYDGGRHEYRVADNFYYLTGFSEPGSVIILTSDKPYPYTLCIRKRKIREEVYVGETPVFKDIMKVYQPDTVENYRGIADIIMKYTRKGMPIYIDSADSYLAGIVTHTKNKHSAHDKSIRNIAPVIDEMRVHKDSIEITRLRKSIDITGEAFGNACRICKPGMYEFEIEAMIEYTYLKQGSSMPSFASIIASGPNSVTLHYEKNDRRMQDGDLLLMDIGAEYGHYAADISRTIPVNGKYTKEQKEIYELVLKAQKAAIAEMIPGNYLVAGQNKSSHIILQGLLKLGLITDPESEWQKKFYLLYPINHYLGMNVHDVGVYGAPDSTFYQNIATDSIYGRKLEKGMVLTVEPGLYFRSNGLSQLFEMFGEEATHEEIQSFIDKVSPAYGKYKDIGVRIEDDILISDNGYIVLSNNIPKEIDEIERIMSK